MNPVFFTIFSNHLPDAEAQRSYKNFQLFYCLVQHSNFPVSTNIIRMLQMF